MTLYQIIDTLKKIALTQPNIRTSTDGDVFDAMNSNPSIKYGVFHVTQTTHTEDEQFDNYGFNLFVIDRLEDDDSNRVSAQSTAKQQLSNIINTFCETFDAERNEIVYQPFTQRFKDNTCGVWASVTMQVVKDYSCAESYGEGAWYPDIVVINNEDITITKNGVYTPSEGYTGFDKVEVAVPIPIVQEKAYLEVQTGQSGILYPDEGYNAMAEVEYVVKPSEDDKIMIPNGINFAYSTFSEFPVYDYNWKNVADGRYMFAYCPNFTGVEEVLEALRDGTMNPLSIDYMFTNMHDFEKLENFDFSKYVSAYNVFGQTNVKEIRNIVLPKGRLFENNYHKTKGFEIDASKSSTYETVFFFEEFSKLNPEYKPFYQDTSYVVHENNPYANYSGPTYSTSILWYEPDKTGWDSPRCFPFGLYYQTPNIGELKLVFNNNVVTDEQVIPYVDGRYYADYSLFPNWDIYVDNELVPDSENKFNVDIYKPQNVDAGTYEGLELSRFIYWWKNDNYSIGSEGLTVVQPDNTSRIYRQKFYTNKKTLTFVIETYCPNDINGVFDNVDLYINSNRILEMSYNKTYDLTYDFNNFDDVVEIGMDFGRGSTSDITNSKVTIKSIKVE